MSVPLDRLYHYIENIIGEIYNSDVLIYRFFPHGSKKFSDLNLLRQDLLNWKEKKLRPQIYFNDQEPLNYDLYKNIPSDQIKNHELFAKLRNLGLDIPMKNFRTETFSLWDYALLVHSEQRSHEVEKYKHCDFLPVYYWSHAVIAQDWFRYAQHVQQKKSVKHRFLIYSRGWSGTREYRLKFLEKIVQAELHNQCQIFIQPVEQETGLHYKDYQFMNSAWQPQILLENYFATTNICPTFSADFETNDYEITDIEVVLETLFDDTRLHFTEKILRPIALGQPFILAGTRGGLEFLRNYGFKTFDQVWSEDYDLIETPEHRLDAIVNLMKIIESWDHQARTDKMQAARQIAEFNKQRFFSSEFQQHVINELKTNLKNAFQDLESKNTGELWCSLREIVDHNKTLQEELYKIRTQQETNEVYEIVKEYRKRNLKVSNNSTGTQRLDSVRFVNHPAISIKVMNASKPLVAE